MRQAMFLVIMLLTACTTVKNISPPATLVPSSLSKEEVESAIILALKDSPKTEQSAGIEMANKILNYALGDGYSRKQYWFYEGRGADVVYAGFDYRNFYMRTEIRYNDREVIFKIVDSRNLKQSENKIHKKAFQWLWRLERNVRATLSASARVKYEEETLNKKSQSAR